MIKHGNYVADVPFSDMCEDKFKHMIKLNAAFGESFANEGYYLYGLKKLFSKSLVPSSFHAKNYHALMLEKHFAKANI